MNLLVLLVSFLVSFLPASPRDVLRQWDERRAAAWVAEDPGALRSLYLPGSTAGEYDVALLQDYRRRGLDVTALETQVLAEAVVVEQPGRLVLRVTDRVTGLQVTRLGERLHLPRDRARTRTIELRRVEGRWLVASVSDA